MPQSGTLYCAKALSRASSARQSKTVRQYSTEPPQIADIAAIGPQRAGSLVGIPRAPEPFAQIGDGLVGDSQDEGLRLRSHTSLRLMGPRRVFYDALVILSNCRCLARHATPSAFAADGTSTRQTEDYHKEA